MAEVINTKAAMLGHALNGKVHTIHIWADDSNIMRAKRAENPLVNRFGTRGKFVVGYSGNMGRFHDMETIMEAAERLRDQDDIIFLFVGEGHKKQWMMDFAEGRGLPNCRFHTYVCREELGHLLSLADVGLVSLMDGQEGLSVPSKTFGLMAAGVPILGVMSGRSEIARIIDEERCGKVIRPGDSSGLAAAILRLHRDTAEREFAGRQSTYAIRREYNLHEAAKQYLDLIESIRMHDAKG
jgi:glycosyltransferase involved in cell wall biosynthesis